MLLNSRLFLQFFLRLLAGCCLYGCATSPAVAVNLALSAPYAYQPVAQYPYTMDSGDAVELTDGRYAQKHFWTARDQTVGWLRQGVIRLEIDLRSSYAIEQVCLNTARSIKAGVSFPQRIDIFASADGMSYQYLGDLMRDADHSDGSYLVKKFTKDLRTAARYLVFFIEPKGNYTFIDEIEVWGPGIQSMPSRAYPINKSDLASVQKKLVRTAHLTRAIDKELSEWSYSSGDLVSTASVRDSDENAVVNLDEKFFEVVSTTIDQGGPVSAEHVLSENSLFSDEELLSEIYALHVAYLASRFTAPLIVWHNNPWAPFSSLDTPTSERLLKESFSPLDDLSLGQRFNETLQFDLLRGGTASEAIILSNNSSEKQSYKVSIKEDGIVDSFPNIEVREAQILLLAEDELRADPLVELSDRTIVIRPGESKQLWLTAHGGSASAGVYNAKMILAKDGEWSPQIQVPLQIKVWAAQTPRQQSLMVNTWSYLTWRAIKNIPEKAVADLSAHHCNVAILHPSQIPWPVNFKTGAFATPDYSQFDRFINLSRNANKFLFYMDFNTEARRNLGGTYAFMSDEWQKLFKQWIRDWVQHAFELGLNSHDFAFYPIDEPDGSTEAGYLIEIAKLIKEVDPELQVYTTIDQVGRISSDDFSKLSELVDIFQIGLNSVTAANVTPLKERGKEVWSYASGGKITDPLGFYRLQAWRAFKNGITGIGFWAYADMGNAGTAWNDLDGNRPDFSVIYEGENDVVSSKRWEAWREGIEDYQLLELAKAKVNVGKESEELKQRVDWVIQHPDDYAYFQETKRFLLTIASR